MAWGGGGRENGGRGRGWEGEGGKGGNKEFRAGKGARNRGKISFEQNNL